MVLFSEKRCNAKCKRVKHSLKKKKKKKKKEQQEGKKHTLIGNK
jgi:hypothetical protein